MSDWLNNWNKRELAKSYLYALRYHEMCIEELKSKLKELSRKEGIQIVLKE
jgi:hypothetical protein